MAILSTSFHIATLLKLAAARETGIFLYKADGQSREDAYSYKDLHDTALRKAHLLHDQDGISQGQIVLIHLKEHWDVIVWFWATILAGCVPVISTPLTHSVEGRTAHFNHLHSLLLDPSVITRERLATSEFADNEKLRLITVEAIEARGGYPSGDCSQSSSSSSSRSSSRDCTDQRAKNERSLHRVVSTNTAGLSNHNGFDDPQVSSRVTDDIAFMMLTSGSTGSSKAVCLSHEQILAAVVGKLTIMPIPLGTALLNWIGLDHVASLVEIHLCAMFAGLNQVHVQAEEVIGDPMIFLRLLSEHKVSRTFAPNFFLVKLQDRLNKISMLELATINLSSLLYIASGGEPNSTRVCAEISKSLYRLGASRSGVVVPGFGMTETCAGSIFNIDCPQTDVDGGHEFTAVGKCMPDIEMRITSLADTGASELIVEIRPGVQGSLEIRGTVVFDSYFNNEKATDEAFSSDGWFKTGDLAVIDSAGSLRLVGRSKDLINVNGIKYVPHEIEDAIHRADIAGIMPSFISCFDHRPAGSSKEHIYVVYQHSYAEDDSKARSETLQSIARVVMHLAGTRPKVLPVSPGRLQKTSIGKLSRAKIRNSLLNGEYRDQEQLDFQKIREYRQAHIISPRDEYEQALLGIFRQVVDLDDVSVGIDTDILEAGVSSVDLIRVKIMSEKAFKRDDIPIITILNNTTIRKLAEAIREQNEMASGSGYDPVVVLQPHGTGAPLWLIHPGIGEVLVFLGLVQYFPDRPIYALRARGFNAGERPFKDIHEVVATYHDALKQRQPQGPYAIAGYSYGSMLAFEIGKILESENDKVAFLGSFNLPPHIKERMRLLDWTSGLLHIAHFCGIITEERSERLEPELQGLPTKADKVTRLLSESDVNRCEELAITHPSLLNWTDVAWSLQKIGWEYDPSGRVANLDVFYCQPLKIVAKTREEYREKKLSHWADFTDDVRFHEVDGEHYTMIGPEHVNTFQRTLRNVLTARGI